MKKQNIIFCTYFDKNYLLKGLALHSSLLRHHPQAELWILCMDDYTENILTKMNLKGVILIALSDFEDEELRGVKKNRTLVEYCWTCTPSLPLYIFKKSLIVKHIVYLDADIYFYSSINPVFTELGNKSIFTVEHRYPKGQETRMKTSGRFNVGFQIFNRDKESLECLNRWREQCLKWCYWQDEDGKLGDQLYLNEWPELYKNLVISKNLGINAAPWNIGQFIVNKNGDKIYLNEEELICYHFHQFEILGFNSFERAYGYHLSTKIVEYIYKPYEMEMTRQAQVVKNMDEEFEIVPPKKNIMKRVNLLLTKFF